MTVDRMAWLGVLLMVSWSLMTFTHEAGHIIGGWLGGATLVDFDVVPWRLPYSLHHPDPSPRLTLWAGPILGVAVPWGLALWFQYRWLRFIADFCLLANGLYLALAWLGGDPLLDTQRLLHSGASPIAIGAYCTLTIGVGYIRFRRTFADVLSHGMVTGPASPPDP